MTSMLERPATDARAKDRPRRSREDVVGTLPVAAITAALWAAGVGLVVVAGLVTLAWALTGRGADGLTTPLSASGVVWLAGHHAAVGTGTVVVTLLPMLLLALPLTLLVLAGRWAVRITNTATVPDAVLLVTGGAATYALVGVLVAQAASLAGAEVPTIDALVATALVAILGLGTGVVAGGPLRPALAARVPVLVRDALLAAGAVAGSLAVVVGLVALLAVALRWAAVTSLSHQLAPAAGDAVGMALLSLAYLPNLLVWTLSYVAGTGFAVGGDVVVTPFSGGGALLPGVPLLGALPTTAPAAGPLLLLLPVLAGVMGAVVLRRRRALEPRAELLTLVVSAAIVGAGTLVLAALAGGGLGAGRLAVLGPPAAACGLAVAALVLAGSLLVALGSRALHLLPTIWVTGDH